MLDVDSNETSDREKMSGVAPMTTLSKLSESFRRTPLRRVGGSAAFLLAAVAASIGYGQSTSTTGDETTRGTQVYVYDRDEETGEFRRRTASSTTNTTATQVGGEEQPGEPTDPADGTGETDGFEFEDAAPAPAVGTTGRIQQFESTPRDGVPPRGEAVPPISNAVPPLGNRQFGQPLNPPDVDPTVTVIGEPPNVENVDNGEPPEANQNRTPRNGTARRSFDAQTEAPPAPARANPMRRRTDNGSTSRFGSGRRDAGGRLFDGRRNQGAIQNNQPIQDGARIQPGSRFGGNSRQFDAQRTGRFNSRGSQFGNGTARPGTTNRTGTGAIRGPSQFGANPGTGATNGGTRSGVSGGAASGGTGAAAGGGGTGGPR